MIEIEMHEWRSIGWDCGSGPSFEIKHMRVCDCGELGLYLREQLYAQMMGWA